MYDIIIIGGGSAGLTAGIYAGRAGLKTLLIEKSFIGGQVVTTYEVDNYPGVEEKISGPDLALKMEAQAKRFNVEFSYEDVQDVELDGIIKKIKTSNNYYEAKVVILTMGAKSRELGLNKERDFRGAGVSYCATCDSAFYKDMNVAVVGGGDTALEDAVFLSRFCPKVYIVHRNDEFTGTKILQKEVLTNNKIEILWNSTVEEIIGQSNVEGLIVKNIKNNIKAKLDVKGLFVAIGTKPNTELVLGKVDLNKHGYIITDECMQTNKYGVYAAGDLREKVLRQVITAASDGAIAAYCAQRYISENKF